MSPPKTMYLEAPGVVGPNGRSLVFEGVSFEGHSMTYETRSSGLFTPSYEVNRRCCSSCQSPQHGPKTREPVDHGLLTVRIKYTLSPHEWMVTAMLL